MEVIRQHILFRLFWLTMALNILNCSVDTPDGRPDSEPEDLTVNDMESVVELVLEKGFRIDNAVEEHDENDTGGGGALEIKKDVNLYLYPSHAFSQFDMKLSNVSCSMYIESSFVEYHPESSSPPPEFQA